MDDEIKFIKIGDITVSMTHCSTDKFFGVCEHACSINGAKTRYVSSPVIVEYCIKNKIPIPIHFIKSKL